MAEDNNTQHHHHHHHHHYSETEGEKVGLSDIFEKSKYKDSTSQFRFHMNKRRKMKLLMERVIWIAAVCVLIIMLALLYYAYFVDKQY